MHITGETPKTGSASHGQYMTNAVLWSIPVLEQLAINLEPLTGATGKSPVTITITPDHTGPLIMALVHAPVTKSDMPSQYPILEGMFNGIASDPLRPKQVDEVSDCERKATPPSSPGRPTTAVEQRQSLEPQVDKAQFWQLLIDGSSNCPPGFYPGP